MFHRRYMRLTAAALGLCLCATVGCTPAAELRGDLLAGVSWEYSTDGAKTWTSSPPVVPPGATQEVQARVTFTVAKAPPCVALAFTPGLPPRQNQTYYLNGQVVPTPLAGMYYRTIPAIPAGLLKAGDNELRAALDIDNRPPPKETVPPLTIRLATRLAPLTEADLAFQTGPILGAFGPDVLTVACRTNLPAKVTLAVRGPGSEAPFVEQASNGLIHRFRADGLKVGPDRQVEYALTAERGGHVVRTPWRAVTLPAATPQSMRFVVAGDSRSHPDRWARVAQAIDQARPEFVVFTGDMVDGGRNDWLWDEAFFGPSGGLFARVPIYAIPGNHEESAPVYPLLFHTPGGDGTALHWHQRLGDVLLIGSDLRDKKWSEGKTMVQWLEGILANDGRTAKFVFFIAHYPAFGSGKHCEVDEDGKPVESAVARCRRVIVPLLAKHQVTALVAGHEHNYERSEMPGLSMITSGGAGAPIQKKRPTAEKQNPHSVVFAGVLHYCLFTVSGDECVMQAIDVSGKVFDTRTYKPRAGLDASARDRQDDGYRDGCAAHGTLALTTAQGEMP